MKQPKLKIETRAEIYQRAHTAILNNPYWYSDRPGLLSEEFNAEKLGNAPTL